MDETPTPTQEGMPVQPPTQMPTPGPMPMPEAPKTETPPISTPPEGSPVPPVPKKSNTVLWIAIILFVLALLAGGAYVVLNTGLLTKEKACTQDAKVCPDGSTVGRVGPNCEFAPCPTPLLTPEPTPEVTPAESPSPTPTTTPSASPSP